MRLVALPICLIATACGLVSGSDSSSSLEVGFYGYSAALSTTEVELRVQVGGHGYSWTGAHSATETSPQTVAQLDLHGGQALSAVAILRSAQGVELARATTTLAIQSSYGYGLGFQVGGRNPDTRGFCHQPPQPVAIPGFPGDSLFLWKSALPRGAVC